MPAPQYTYANFVSGPVPVVTTAETVVATTRSVSSPSTGSSFWIVFRVAFLTGAGTTGINWRIRRDGLTGAVVIGPELQQWAAAFPQPTVIEAIDTFTGEVASQLWVLTAAPVAATGNGSATNIATAVTTPV